MSYWVALHLVPVTPNVGHCEAIKVTVSVQEVLTVPAPVPRHISSALHLLARGLPVGWGQEVPQASGISGFVTLDCLSLSG